MARTARPQVKEAVPPINAPPLGQAHSLRTTREHLLRPGHQENKLRAREVSGLSVFRRAAQLGAGEPYGPGVKTGVQNQHLPFRCEEVSPASGRGLLPQPNGVLHQIKPKRIE